MTKRKRKDMGGIDIGVEPMDFSLYGPPKKDDEFIKALKKQFVNGKITKEEYFERKKVLSGGGDLEDIGKAVKKFYDSLYNVGAKIAKKK